MTLHDSLKLDMARRLESAAQHTGAMVALIPEHATALRLAVPGYEPVEQLHVTLAFLGDAAQWTDHHRWVATSTMAAFAADLDEPVVGKLWAAGSFNPRGDEPCAAHLVGEVSKLTFVHRMVWRSLDAWDLPIPVQHQPWIPHLTIGYNLPVTSIEAQAVGNVHFDRLRVAFAGEHWDYPLP